jgi:YD repeat-containing protein
MPHPYIGMLFRPKDFVSCSLLSILPPPPEAAPPSADASPEEIGAFIAAQALNTAHTAAVMAISSMGASVMIGFFPRAVAGTPSKNIPHIPMGAGFSPPFAMVQKNVGHSFLGCLTVSADGDPLSGAIAHLHNDCWDVGAINLHGEEGVPAFMRFYMPSGISTSIPGAKITLVNPVPTPLNPMQSAKMLKAGLGKLGRKGFQKILDKTGKNAKLKNKLGGCPGLTKLSQKYGTGKSHPVDVSEGHFYTDNMDFSFPGVIPFEFRRQYFSYNDRHGCLGVGWSHPYDMALALDYDEDLAAVRLGDGRTTGFRIPAKGASDFNRKEKIRLHHNEDGSFHISDQTGLLYRFTGREYKNPYAGEESFLLQSVSNRNGYSLRMEYDGEGIPKKFTDTAGRIFTVENDGKGHISRIIAPAAAGRDKTFVLSSYEYDAHGRLVAQTDALGAIMRFEYEGSLMTKEIWRNGLTWTIRYRGKGREAKCVEITGDNNLFHYYFDYAEHDCTLVTDSLGNKTTYYHKDGVVTKRIDPNGGESVFRYNKYTELEWTIDPVGNGEGQTQDELGNLVTRTAADGGFTLLKYENYAFPWLPTSATDAAGGKWKWEYDERGNLVKRTDPLGADTLFEYTDGLLTKIILSP